MLTTIPIFDRKKKEAVQAAVSNYFCTNTVLQSADFSIITKHKIFKIAAGYDEEQLAMLYKAGVTDDKDIWYIEVQASPDMSMDLVHLLPRTGFFEVVGFPDGLFKPCFTHFDVLLYDAQISSIAEERKLNDYRARIQHLHREIKITKKDKSKFEAADEDTLFAEVDDHNHLRVEAEYTLNTNMKTMYAWNTYEEGWGKQMTEITELSKFVVEGYLVSQPVVQHPTQAWQKEIWHELGLTIPPLPNLIDAQFHKEGGRQKVSPALQRRMAKAQSAKGKGKGKGKGAGKGRGGGGDSSSGRHDSSQGYDQSFQQSYHTPPHRDYQRRHDRDHPASLNEANMRQHDGNQQRQQQPMYSPQRYSGYDTQQDQQWNYQPAEEQRGRTSTRGSDPSRSVSRSRDERSSNNGSPFHLFTLRSFLWPSAPTPAPLMSFLYFLFLLFAHLQAMAAAPKCFLRRVRRRLLSRYIIFVAVQLTLTASAIHIDVPRMHYDTRLRTLRRNQANRSRPANRNFIQKIISCACAIARLCRTWCARRTDSARSPGPPGVHSLVPCGDGRSIQQPPHQQNNSPRPKKKNKNKVTPPPAAAAVTPNQAIVYTDIFDSTLGYPGEHPEPGPPCPLEWQGDRMDLSPAHSRFLKFCFLNVDGIARDSSALEEFLVTIADWSVQLVGLGDTQRTEHTISHIKYPSLRCWDAADKTAASKPVWHASVRSKIANTTHQAIQQ